LYFALSERRIGHTSTDRDMIAARGWSAVTFRDTVRDTGGAAVSRDTVRGT
jgi:hypothetical protein